jgi:hypothetical protein
VQNAVEDITAFGIIRESSDHNHNPMLKRREQPKCRQENGNLVTVDLGLVWALLGETEVFGLDIAELGELNVDVIEM